MARLSVSDRKNLPLSSFAVPSKAPGPGSYPMPDAAHAKNAKSRAAQFASPKVEAKVDKMANAKLGKKDAITGETIANRKSRGVPKGRKRPIAKPKASKPMGKPGVL